MDWHLLGKYSILNIPLKEHVMLRTRLHFGFEPVYYAAAIFDTLARFLWILRLWTFQQESKEFLDSFLVFVEIIRRWVWVFFRLEREFVSKA